MTPKQEQFVAEYLIDFNGKAAAIRAGYSAHSAKVIASKLLAQPAIAEAVRQARDRTLTKVEHTGEDVLRELWRFVQADANELIEHRRVACRFCYGINHRYQCTPSEREQRYSAFLKLAIAAMENAKRDDPVPQFDELGGIGYSRKREPHADCPECHGEGEAQAFAKDTRKLSPAARALYAGIKAKADGSIEVMQHSKDKALELLGRHYGFWTDQQKPEEVGPGLTVVVQNAVTVEGQRVTQGTRITVDLAEPE